MHDSLLEDQGHLDDPHLWERARALGLDLDRFEADRRSASVEERVQRDFRSGIGPGWSTTPTQFVGGERHPGVPDEELIRTLWARHGAERRISSAASIRRVLKRNI